MLIRLATLHDIPELCRQRRRMFEDMGHTDAAALQRMTERFAEWVARYIQSDEYLAWLAFDDDRCVAGVGLWLVDWPCHILDPEHRRGYILNVYTEPSHRQQGLARQLTERAISHCESLGIEVISLHASEHGRALYESLGFEASNEMRRVKPEKP
jgi:ribosomal protein S18 acetylase RimI-like enzyme